MGQIVPDKGVNFGDSRLNRSQKPVDSNSTATAFWMVFRSVFRPEVASDFISSVIIENVGLGCPCNIWLFQIKPFLKYLSRSLRSNDERRRLTTATM